MRKLSFIAAMIAITAILFQSCTPQPATPDDIEAAKELMVLMQAADDAGLIDRSEENLDPDNNTVSLKEPYKSPSGDVLSSYTLTTATTDTGAVSAVLYVSGTVSGRKYTIKGSSSYMKADQDNAAVEITINGRPADLSEFE